MNITIYSGSFNPIHLGHEALALFLVENKIADEVWLVVTPSNPLKNSSDMINHSLRFDMVKLVSDGRHDIKPSDIEFNMPVPSYTVDTLRKLSLLYPQHQFSLLIGSDNATVFDQWRNYEEILENYQVLVYPRLGDNLSSISQRFPKLEFIPAPYLNISSTEIREKIRNEEDCSAILNPKVKDYILKHDLYK